MAILHFFQLLLSTVASWYKQTLEVVIRSLLWLCYNFVLHVFINKTFYSSQYVIGCKMFCYTLTLVARVNEWSKIVDLFLPLQKVVLFWNPKDTAVSFFHFHNSVPSVPSYSSRDELFLGFMTDLHFYRYWLYLKKQQKKIFYKQLDGASGKTAVP